MEKKDNVLNLLSLLSKNLNNVYENGTLGDIPELKGDIEYIQKEISTNF